MSQIVSDYKPTSWHHPTKKTKFPKNYLLSDHKIVKLMIMISELKRYVRTIMRNMYICLLFLFFFWVRVKVTKKFFLFHYFDMICFWLFNLYNLCLLNIMNLYYEWYAFVCDVYMKENNKRYNWWCSVTFTFFLILIIHRYAFHAVLWLNDSNFPFKVTDFCKCEVQTTFFYC